MVGFASAKAANRPIFDIIPDFGVDVKRNFARPQTKDQGHRTAGWRGGYSECLILDA
jgi:hypothetical protein